MNKSIKTNRFWRSPSVLNWTVIVDPWLSIFNCKTICIFSLWEEYTFEGEDGLIWCHLDLCGNWSLKPNKNLNPTFHSRLNWKLNYWPNISVKMCLLAWLWSKRMNEQGKFIRKFSILEAAGFWMWLDVNSWERKHRQYAIYVTADNSSIPEEWKHMIKFICDQGERQSGTLLLGNVVEPGGSGLRGISHSYRPAHSGLPGM